MEDDGMEDDGRGGYGRRIFTPKQSPRHSPLQCFLEATCPKICDV